MDIKDVTPSPKKKQKSSGFFKKFGIGLLGGIIGGLLTVGIFYVAIGTNLSTNQSNSGNQNSQGETVVDKVNVDVNSDITTAVEKVQGAVVSIVNLQKQSNSLSGLDGLFGQQSGNETENSSDTLEEASEGSGMIDRD